SRRSPSPAAGRESSTPSPRPPPAPTNRTTPPPRARETLPHRPRKRPTPRRPQPPPRTKSPAATPARPPRETLRPPLRRPRRDHPHQREGCGDGRLFRRRRPRRRRLGRPLPARRTAQAPHPRAAPRHLGDGGRRRPRLALRGVLPRRGRPGGDDRPPPPRPRDHLRPPPAPLDRGAPPPARGRGRGDAAGG